MRTTAVILAITVCLARYAPAEVGPVEAPHPEVGPAALSAAQTESLGKIAATHPCAATALGHILRDPSSPGDGALYLDEVPLPVPDSTAAPGTPRIGIERNPYSSNLVFVMVRWRSRKLPAGSFLLRFGSELVDRLGRALQPPHTVEDNVGVILSDRREILVIEDSHTAVAQAFRH